MCRRSIWLTLQLLVLTPLLVTPASAQYFGRNKVQYENFDFQVVRTEHFEIYHYPEEAEAVALASRMAERWYARLSELLDHELTGTGQALVLYASHPHFQQTNVIESFIGEGTGGVTESLKRRIVLPFAGGLGETDHVLGHELVHAFQYDILGPNLALPLWFIEGMAEYLSIGSTDAHTAVWLRDAAGAERLPTLKDLDNPRYFPYRFGHAFWAYVGQRYGDKAIASILFSLAGPPGNQRRGGGDAIGTIERVLGTDEETLSAEWHASILATMVKPLSEREPVSGKGLIEPAEDNEINVGPVLSPDGSRLALLTSRDRFSIDLAVADATTGRIERTLTETAADPHFDSLQFIESAGSWDPAGQRIAFAALRKGRPVIAILDATSGDRVRELALGEIDEALQPAWSPDGRQIVFAGLTGGLLDLHLVELESGQLRRLTHDVFAEAQPSWSPDGRSIVFTTDRFSSKPDFLAFGDHRLAILELSSGNVEALPTFEGANHVSPQWTEGSVYFTADPDGVPDVYRLDLGSRQVARITRSATGVVGITAQSPNLTVARGGSRLAYVLYRRGSYEIRAIEGDGLRADLPVPSRTPFDGARLAPASQATSVDRLLGAAAAGLPPAGLPAPEPYRPRISLDYAGQEFGVGTSAFGSYVGGGLSLRFSDMLGDHVVETVAQVNGGLQDFGGRIGYLNRRSRWNWGGFLQQIPYVTGGYASGLSEIDGATVFLEQEVRDRQIDRQATGVLQYPFSSTRRVEFGAGVRSLSFEREFRTRAFDLRTGRQVLNEQESEDLAEPITLGQATAAFVQDTSLFGPTSPILGSRSRIEVSPAIGDLRFTTVVADARQYVMPFRPVTIAARALHIGRYGGDAESIQLSPLFLGFETLVRGYDVGSYTFEDCGSNPGRCDSFEQLIGSRLLVAGLELRAPLVGLFTGDLDYGPLPVELFGFFDAGVAWTADTRPSGFGASNERPWARSAGAGLRVNAFGYVILELAAARALDRPNSGWQFLFGLRPGF